ncbi:MAG: hypothetical protein ACI9DF_004542 [Verrucomicrobiales bacterium]|jgi:hypothetical protein
MNAQSEAVPEPIKFEIVYDPRRREWLLHADTLPRGALRFPEGTERKPGQVGLIGAIGMALLMGRENGGEITLRYIRQEYRLSFELERGGGHRMNYNDGLKESS